MTSESACAKTVYPVIADPDTSRSQGIIARERLIGARIIVAALKNHVSIGIKDLATPLCISA